MEQQHQKKSPTSYECPVCPMSMTTTKLSSVQALRQHLKAHGSLQRVVMCCTGCERVEEKDSGTTITTAITTSITPTSTGSKGTIISPAFITPLLLYRHIRQQHGIRQETEVLEMISKSIANGIEEDDDEDEDQGGGQGGDADFEEAYHEAMENEAVEEARRQRANGARFRCTRCGTCGTQALLEEHSCLPRGAKSPPLQDIFVEEEKKPDEDNEDEHKEMEDVVKKFKKEIRAAGVAPKETEEDEEVEEEDKEVKKEEEEDDDDDEIEVLDVPELPLPTVEQIMLPLNIRKMVKFNVDVPYVALPDPSFQHKEMHLKDNNDFHTGKHYILVPLVSLVQASD